MSAAAPRLSATKLALMIRQEHASAPISSQSREPIAIIGLACRLPGAESTAEFWQNLVNGVDSVTDPPDDRWPERPAGIPFRAGYLKQIDLFEPGFFGISPREAEHLDPQHRLLLEVTWEALWNAGIAPGKFGREPHRSLHCHLQWTVRARSAQPAFRTDGLFEQWNSSEHRLRPYRIPSRPAWSRRFHQHRLLLFACYRAFGLPEPAER